MLHFKNKIFKNRIKTAIGLCSGTSVDGIDTVLLKIQGTGINTKLKVLDFITLPYPLQIKKAILKNSNDETAKISEICRLNIILGKLFAQAVMKICKRNSIKFSSINFIGSHGQTIHHLPQNKNYFGYKVKSTLQIGDPSVIANLTGITTVGDFRVGDCAVDGDGAPLIPYLDYILFRSNTLNRGLLNIGGIANITILPKSCSKYDVFAYDTGPGNMIIDGLMKKLFRKEFDKDGKTANKGKIDYNLLRFLKKNKYYKLPPPKSTGREVFGEKFQNNIINNFLHIKKEDIIRTAVEFTVFTIYYSYQKFISPKIILDELIVSGGGANNPLLMDLLKHYFKGVSIVKMDKSGITADSKEAVLFAVLANECLAGNSTNMKKVTGSKKDVILGKICK